MHDVKRFVGGGFFDNLWTCIKRLAPKIPGIAKSVLGHFKDENPLANSAHNVLSALGSGRERRERRKGEQDIVGLDPLELPQRQGS